MFPDTYAGRGVGDSPHTSRDELIDHVINHDLCVVCDRSVSVTNEAVVTRGRVTRLRRQQLLSVVVFTTAAGQGRHLCALNTERQ